jgi:hypothetical protein
MFIFLVLLRRRQALMDAQPYPDAHYDRCCGFGEAIARAFEPRRRGACALLWLCGFRPQVLQVGSTFHRKQSEPAPRPSRLFGD